MTTITGIITQVWEETEGPLCQVNLDAIPPGFAIIQNLVFARLSGIDSIHEPSAVNKLATNLINKRIIATLNAPIGHNTILIHIQTNQ